MSLETAHNKALKCTHCGEPCVDELIQNQGENFCCEGCKMVYEILLENDLDNFYCVADSPGVNKKKNNDTYADKIIVKFNDCYKGENDKNYEKQKNEQSIEDNMDDVADDVLDYNY